MGPEVIARIRELIDRMVAQAMTPGRGHNA